MAAIPYSSLATFFKLWPEISTATNQEAEVKQTVLAPGKYEGSSNWRFRKVSLSVSEVAEGLLLNVHQPDLVPIPFHLIRYPYLPFGATFKGQSRNNISVLIQGENLKALRKAASQASGTATITSQIKNNETPIWDIQLSLSFKKGLITGLQIKRSITLPKVAKYWESISALAEFTIAGISFAKKDDKTLAESKAEVKPDNIETFTLPQDESTDKIFEFYINNHVLEKVQITRNVITVFVNDDFHSKSAAFEQHMWQDFAKKIKANINPDIKLAKIRDLMPEHTGLHKLQDGSHPHVHMLFDGVEKISENIFTSLVNELLSMAFIDKETAEGLLHNFRSY